MTRVGQGDVSCDLLYLCLKVSLRREGSHICGGALISRRLVVTAAYCVYSLVPYDLTVVSGTSKLTSLTHVSSVGRIVWHENYTVKNNKRINDIALLEVHSDMTPSSNNNVFPFESPSHPTDNT
uniref:(California timema) hypothetical protein n=1 Tax=Timema californicum TaxID=61474 RepID=A0A7R9JLT8_TIMCA|nr:unnamed protein product [Timema californicum]